MTTEGFAAVPNWMIRDSSFTIYAIAVYAALASHSGRGGIYPSQETLAAEARCSERKVREALTELRDAGVIRWEQRRNGPTGRANNGYTLHPNGPELVPAPRAATPEVPAPGAASSGTQRQEVPAYGAGEEEPFQEEPGKKNPPTPQGASEPSPVLLAFEAVWKSWPRKVDKALALRAWTKHVVPLPLDQARLAYNMALTDGAIYATWPKAEEHVIPHFTTWINRHRWNDDSRPQTWDQRRTLTRNERNMQATMTPEYNWGEQREITR